MASNATMYKLGYSQVKMFGCMVCQACLQCS